jgi:hypothetical protein
VFGGGGGVYCRFLIHKCRKSFKLLLRVFIVLIQMGIEGFSGMNW